MIFLFFCFTWGSTYASATDDMGNPVRKGNRKRGPPKAFWLLNVRVEDEDSDHNHGLIAEELSIVEDAPIGEEREDAPIVETPPQKRQIEKGKWGGWRPGGGRPRRNHGTPLRKRYKQGEPRPPRGRPWRKIS